MTPESYARMVDDAEVRLMDLVGEKFIEWAQAEAENGVSEFVVISAILQYAMGTIGATIAGSPGIGMSDKEIAENLSHKLGIQLPGIIERCRRLAANAGLGVARQ